MSLSTFRDRWTLFAGALLSVALGVALVQSSTVLLAAASHAQPAPGTTPAEARDLRATADGLSSLMGISIVLGLFLTVFIIGSTMAFTVVERRRELAVLRLSGASRRQVRRLLVGEGLVVGVLGTALGVLLGLLATAVEIHFVNRVGLDTGVLEVGFPSWVLLVDLAAGLGSALAGVLVASRRAGRVRPLDALRDVGQERRVMTWGRWMWALVLGIPAAVGAFVVQATGDLLASILVSLLVIVTGSVALQQLSPLVVPLVARLFAVPARRHVLSELAQAGMRDGVRRTATTAGPVIVLFGLVVGLFGILATLAQATRIERVQQSSADLVVVSDGDVSDRVRAVPGVSVADPETDTSLPVRVFSDTGHWSSVESPVVTAVDPAAHARLVRQPMLAGRMSLVGPGRVALGPAAPEDGLGTPRAVLVGDTRAHVVARVATTIAGGADVIVARSDVPPAQLRNAPTTTFVELAHGASAAEIRTKLSGIERVSTVSSVPVWARGLADEQARENDAVMAALAGLGGLYAFLSTVNAVAVGTAQRRGEFAVARVTGATRAQTIAATALESLVVGVIGVALGAAVVAVCLLGVRRGIAGSLGVSVLEVPWGLSLVLAVAALAACAGTAAAAAWSATRTEPVRLIAAHE